MCMVFAVAAIVADIALVDPLIGTGSKREVEGDAGGMMPYVGVPFGMWQWVPMTRLSEHGVTSFSPVADGFLGFVATRQPAPWMGDFGPISLIAQATEEPVCDYAQRKVSMVKDQCVYTPYYAKVVTADGVISEVTASSRAAMLRFTFPKGAKRRIVFDASRVFRGHFSSDVKQPGGISFGSFFSSRSAAAWNTDRADSVETPDLKNFKSYFAIEFSEPFVSCGTYVGGACRGPRPKPGRPGDLNDYPGHFMSPGSDVCEGDVAGGWCEFAAGNGPVVVRIGNSFISCAKAEDNLRREAPDGFAFETMKATARTRWEEKLGVVSVKASEKVLKIFKTAQYHAMLFPREIDEYGEYYSGFDDAVHEGDVSYTSYSMWDTYRAEHAYLTLAAPERVDGMMRSLLQNYREGGWLPKWPNLTYTGQMTGDPAVSVLAEAYAKGFRGFDAELAWQAGWKSAMTPTKNDTAENYVLRRPWRGHPLARCGLTRYMEIGYVAADECAESVSRTQDFGLYDCALASLGEALGHRNEAAFLRGRARNYRNVWNAEKGFFWPRYRTGRWKEVPFTYPPSGGHGDYTECLPETSVWAVPYDVPGLCELMGGRERTLKRLNDFFDNFFFNQCGGTMSFHDNEPTHHCAYLYNLLGDHDCCALTVRKILDTAYTTEPWGFEGNDDCGQMSSWYILSALGFYPVLPHSGMYEIGSPLVDEAEIRIGAPFEAAVFRIVTHNQSDTHRRVASVRLNGVELKDRRLAHADIVRGGLLEFDMH